MYSRLKIRKIWKSDAIYGMDTNRTVFQVAIIILNKKNTSKRKIAVVSKNRTIAIKLDDQNPTTLT